MAQVIDELRRESVRSRVAREFGAKPIEPAPRGGLDQVLGAPPRDERRTLALANDPLDPRRGLAELGVKDAGALATKPRRPAGSAMPVTISRQPSPSAKSSQHHSQRRMGPFCSSGTGKGGGFPAIRRIPPPIAPGTAQPCRGHNGGRGPRHRPVPRTCRAHAAEFPKASGVGDKRPDRRRGPGEIIFPTVAVESVAIPFHAGLPIPLSSAVSGAQPDIDIAVTPRFVFRRPYPTPIPNRPNCGP